MIDSQIPNSKSQIVIAPNRTALARTAAEQFVTLARQCISAQGRFSVALSGGSTPRDLFTLLATPEFAAQIDWEHVHLFWGDERAVSPNDPSSNFKMTNDTLISHVPIPLPNVHRMKGELPANDAAKEYEAELREFFQPQRTQRKEISSSMLSVSSVASYPRFDLILLGLGANGHTASLFPHTQVLHETQRWVAAEYIDEVKMNRITLTAPVINAASNILWLVAGADKAQTVYDVLHGAYRPEELPAQLIKPTSGTMMWLFDQEASKQVQS
jgi:6-phosphogluconolactonase